MLRTALGPSIAAWLDDPAVIEVMLNPDGRLWLDRLGEGVSDTGETLTAADGERIVRLVAHHVGVEVHARSPRVSAELPEGGERFEGLLPPVVAAPAFAIRKPAVAVFTLDDYAAAGIMSPAEAAALRDGVAARANILVAGGTGSGKTTLVNALLAEVAKTTDRIVLIEDTRELQCAAPNLVAMRTKDGVVSLSELVRSSLRLRPDRIPIGEVRGAEALDLIKAWGTGHPGGIGTIHAGTALGALRRMEQLVQEAVVTVPRALIAETIDLIAVLVRDAQDLGGMLADEAGDGVQLQPLARIDDPAERAWAAEWLAAILASEGVAVDPQAKEHIWSALNSLASAPVSERTLTGLAVLLQNQQLKQALASYCIGGPWGRLLDAEDERLGEAAVQAFETEGLVGAGSAAAVLSYLFHRIDGRLDGSPTLIIIDEGWLVLDSPDFAAQLREWLKTLRKKNASVVFATQSLADIETSSIAPAIIESCPTRIFLPNERAAEPQIAAIYERFGLNARQIEILSRATPKRDYYCQSRRGNRLFELGLGEVALAFSAASAKADQLRIADIIETHGQAAFAAEWLRHRGCAWAIELLPPASRSYRYDPTFPAPRHSGRRPRHRDHRADYGARAGLRAARRDRL